MQSVRVHRRRKLRCGVNKQNQCQARNTACVLDCKPPSANDLGLRSSLAKGGGSRQPTGTFREIDRAPPALSEKQSLRFNKFR